MVFSRKELLSRNSEKKTRIEIYYANGKRAAVAKEIIESKTLPSGDVEIRYRNWRGIECTLSGRGLYTRIISE